MSQAAPTWQSSRERKALVLAGPIMPQPMTPMVMRLEGAVRAQETRGSMAAAPAALRNERRLMEAGVKDAGAGFCMVISRGALGAWRGNGLAPRIGSRFDTCLYIRRDSLANKRYGASWK